MADIPYFNPWAAPMFAQPGFSDFRRSDNIEDRRKEMFNSFPQTPQMPNVFWNQFGGYEIPANLSPHTDYAPQPAQPSELSNQAGAGLLDSLIQQYLTARQ